LLEEIGIKETILCPDTRMDRVQSIAHSNTQNKNIENFLVNKNCILVAGSTWQADIDILFPFINNHPEYAYIIAPHQLNENTLSYIETKLTIPNIRYSLIENKESIFESVLIIDNMGMLASLYKHGKYTYVGGGFGISVHNVLEAIVYEKPVMFGPHHKKQNECSILLDRNVATIVYTSKEIEENILSMENNNSLYLEKCKGAEKYLNENIGGTDIIYEQIKNKI
jgi:3-deoxy-D-manno-octulosonic-acid transferase